MLLCCTTILAIIQYCNFCQLSFWMRSVLATATGVALLLLLYSPLHRYRGTLVICMCTQIPNANILYTHVSQQMRRCLFTHSQLLYPKYVLISLFIQFKDVIQSELLSSNKWKYDHKSEIWSFCSYIKHSSIQGISIGQIYEPHVSERFAALFFTCRFYTYIWLYTILIPLCLK